MSAVHTFLSKLKHIVLPFRIRFALKKRKKLFVVEVGANDGKTGDPLYHFIQKNVHCRALLIEPLPHLFTRLEAAYQGLERCILENIAIASNSGKTTIYYIAPDAALAISGLPNYFEELASFDPGKIANLLGTKGSKFLKEQLVDCFPMDAILCKHGIDTVDLLQIDTEGHDYEVLKTFPFDTITPTVVCFEHCHLSHNDRKAAIVLLSNNGYSIEKWGKDFVCIHRV